MMEAKPCAPSGDSARETMKARSICATLCGMLRSVHLRDVDCLAPEFAISLGVCTPTSFRHTAVFIIKGTRDRKRPERAAIFRAQQRIIVSCKIPFCLRLCKLICLAVDRFRTQKAESNKHYRHSLLKRSHNNSPCVAAICYQHLNRPGVWFLSLIVQETLAGANQPFVDKK